MLKANLLRDDVSNTVGKNLGALFFFTVVFCVHDLFSRVASPRDPSRSLLCQELDVFGFFSGDVQSALM